MQDLLVAIGMAFVLEGLFYASAPEKAQDMMRELIALPPEVLRKAGLIVAAIAVVAIILIRR